MIPKKIDFRSMSNEQFNEWLEGLIDANVHVSVREGARGGSVPLDERTCPDCVPEATVQSTGSESDRGSELSTDVRSIQHGEDVSDAANESVYEGLPEEARLLANINRLANLRTQLFALLKINKTMADNAVREYMEYLYGND